MTEGQSSGAQPEEECAWCKFMKAGPCRKVFEGWQACVDGVKELIEPNSDGKGGNHAVVERCAEVTAPLFECMAKHRYYYGSQLDGMASSSKEREKAAAQAEVQQQGSSNPSSSSSSQPAAAAAAAVSRSMDDGSSRAGSSQAAAAAAAKQTAKTQQAVSSRLATM